MSTTIPVLLVAYMQVGFLLAWYLLHRRTAALRDEFCAELTARDAVLRELANDVGGVRRQLRDAAGNHPKRPASRESQLLIQAKRRGALEMARRGMHAYHIAETLNMRRPEVEMLLHLDQLQRNVHAPKDASEPNWLDTAS